LSLLASEEANKTKRRLLALLLLFGAPPGPRTPPRPRRGPSIGPPPHKYQNNSNSKPRRTRQLPTTAVPKGCGMLGSRFYRWGTISHETNRPCLLDLLVNQAIFVVQAGSNCSRRSSGNVTKQQVIQILLLDGVDMHYA
jgi:hypothetical protein